MKKLMAFIFGLTAGFSLLLFGKANAVSPSKVVDDLRYAVENEHLCEGCDLDLLTHDTDNRCELYGKSFREVVARYTDLLGGCLAKHEPIPFNCRVFALYAFSKFSEKGFNCQYLKIDDAERCAHAVVLVPYEEMAVWIGISVTLQKL